MKGYIDIFSVVSTIFCLDVNACEAYIDIIYCYYLKASESYMLIPPSTLCINVMIVSRSIINKVETLYISLDYLIGAAKTPDAMGGVCA